MQQGSAADERVETLIKARFDALVEASPARPPPWREVVTVSFR